MKVQLALSTLQGRMDVEVTFGKIRTRAASWPGEISAIDSDSRAAMMPPETAA